ncbi:MAG: copper homeostasis protein CutC [Bacteroidales bacterium]
MNCRLKKEIFMIREACVENYDQAQIADRKGIERIELCDYLECGGTTPSYGVIKKSIESISIPIMVIIRPRSGNFIYNNNEIDIMLSDIRICKELGAFGIVIGALTENKLIDEDATRRMIDAARPMQVTFHKAFDEITDQQAALATLISLGCDRVLTSGGKKTAQEGTERLKDLVQLAGDKITILVAGRVTKDNLEELSALIPAKEFHGRLIV